MRLKVLGQNILIALVAVFVCFLVADFAIRKANKMFFRSLYDIRQKDFSRMNSERIKQLEGRFLLDMEKGAVEGETPLVLFIGDSVTLGIPLERAEHTYPDMFDANISVGSVGPERCLARNISGPGGNIMDAVTVINSTYDKYNPDARLLVFGYCLNDIFFSSAQERGLIGIIRQLREGRKIKRENYNDPHFYYYSSKKNQDMVKAAFKDMKEVAKSHDTKVLVAIFPYFIDFGERDYRYKSIHDKVIQFAADAGVEYFDLLPVFSKYHYSSFMTENDHAHPNPLGHKFAADALYKFTAARMNGLLPDLRKTPDVEVVENAGRAKAYCEAIYEGEARHGISACYEILAGLIETRKVLGGSGESNEDYFFIDFDIE